MSSRIHSEFGSIGDRVARMTASEPPSPARHVLARDEAGVWRPALFVGWERRGSAWWGHVAMLEGAEPALVALTAGRLRPADCTCCHPDTPARP